MRRINMHLGSDHILKIKRSVMSAENLFLILDCMSKNRKILCEAQKIGSTLLMGCYFIFYFNVCSLFLW